MKFISPYGIKKRQFSIFNCFGHNKIIKLFLKIKII